jgi:glycosyltransferase involved in cell wall biosynthesis
MKIIAVIPCLNEEQFINDVVAKTLKHVDKVIVVDDGSKDATARVAQEAGAEVVSHPRSQGAGAATRTGFETALKYGADIVVTLDGDGQHNPDEISRLLAPVLEGQADLVIGSRFLDPATNMPAYRKLGIDTITWLYNWGSPVRVSDSQSCFRAHTRKLLEAVKISRSDFSFSIEVLVKSRRLGFAIAEVPISCLYHASGSTMDPLSHGLSVAWSVFRHRFNKK